MLRLAYATQLHDARLLQLLTMRCDGQGHGFVEKECWRAADDFQKAPELAGLLQILGLIVGWANTTRFVPTAVTARIGRFIVHTVSRWLREDTGSSMGWEQGLCPCSKGDDL